MWLLCSVVFFYELSELTDSAVAFTGIASSRVVCELDNVLSGLLAVAYAGIASSSVVRCIGVLELMLLAKWYPCSS